MIRPPLLMLRGFCTVILSAPQYEKLILLLRSESSDSLPGSSSWLLVGVGLSVLELCFAALARKTLHKDETLQNKS